MRLFIILALAIALITVIFALQNTAPVAIIFFGWQLEESLALILLATLAIGVLIGLCVSVPAIVRRSLHLSSRGQQLEELKWTVQERERRLSSQQRDHQTVQQKNHILLSALDLLDPHTGMLKGEIVPQELASLLRQMAYAPDSNHSRTICVYDISTSRGGSSASTAGATLNDAELQAIAHQFRQTIPPDVWLHHRGNGHFVGIAIGLDTQTASDWGESIKTAIANQPIPLNDGTVLSPSISIGAAIADISTPIDSSTLLQQAHDAREHAQRRGRNRFRLVQATR